MNSANEFYTKAKTKLGEGLRTWNYKIDFIKTIEGIDVISFVVISLTKIKFTIVYKNLPEHKLFGYEFNLESFDLRSFKNFITKTEKIIRSLKFDKELGVFKSNICKTSTPLFYDVFGTKYINKSNCIHCNCLTTSILQCNHYCCLLCETKILNESIVLASNTNITQTLQPSNKLIPICPVCKIKLSVKKSSLIEFNEIDDDEFNFIDDLNNSQNNYQNFHYC